MPNKWILLLLWLIFGALVGAFSLLWFGLTNSRNALALNSVWAIAILVFGLLIIDTFVRDLTLAQPKSEVATGGSNGNLNGGIVLLVVIVIMLVFLYLSSYAIDTLGWLCPTYGHSCTGQ